MNSFQTQDCSFQGSNLQQPCQLYFITDIAYLDSACFPVYPTFYEKATVPIFAVEEIQVEQNDMQREDKDFSFVIDHAKINQVSQDIMNAPNLPLVRASRKLLSPIRGQVCEKFNNIGSVTDQKTKLRSENQLSFPNLNTLSNSLSGFPGSQGRSIDSSFCFEDFLSRYSKFNNILPNHQLVDNKSSENQNTKMRQFTKVLSSGLQNNANCTMKKCGAEKGGNELDSGLKATSKTPKTHKTSFLNESQQSSRNSFKKTKFESMISE